MKKGSYIIIIVLLISSVLLSSCSGTTSSPVHDGKTNTIQDAGIKDNNAGKSGDGASKTEGKINIGNTGSSQGNMIYMGRFIENGGWLYFSKYINNDSPTGLYSVKSDGTENVKLNDDRALYLNAEGDFIYYRNDLPPDPNSDWIADKGYIYRINKDGSGRTKIGGSMVKNFLVVDGWIYYQNPDDKMRLYKMKTDGTNNLKVTDNEATYFGVEDGWIYYCDQANPWSLYRVKTDGTGKVKICDQNYSIFIVQDGWIYFLDDYDKGRLHRMKTDGTDNMKLSDEMVSVFNVYGDRVYYTDVSQDGNSRFYMMDADGANKFDLKKDNSGGAMIITGGWVYFSRGGTDFYRMKTDGAGEMKIEFLDTN